MRLKIVHAVGRIFVDVPVELDMREDPALADFIEVLPAAAAAARAVNPEGHFAGLEIVDGHPRDWTVDGRAANGKAWSREVRAMCEGEAAFQALVVVLEESRAVRVSDVERLAEAMRRLTVEAVLPEAAAPAP
jgi:hypothetical protein